MVNTKSSKKEQKVCICERLRFILNIVLKLIAIGAIIRWVWTILQHYEQNQEKLKEYQALEIFAEIDNLAHQQYDEMLATGNPHGRTGEKEFLEIDAEYHNAKTINEKLEGAKKLYQFSKNVVVWLYASPERLESTGDIVRGRKYQEISVLFEELINNKQ